ncbi:hypothetical protein [Peribacillus butanolivorans]
MLRGFDRECAFTRCFGRFDDFPDGLTYTLAFTVTFVVFVVTVWTDGLLGSVFVLTELVFPALSVVVTGTTPFFIVTVNFPELLDFALPVTFVVLSPTPFT